MAESLSLLPFSPCQNSYNFRQIDLTLKFYHLFKGKCEFAGATLYVDEIAEVDQRVNYRRFRLIHGCDHARSRSHLPYGGGDGDVRDYGGRNPS